MKVLFLIKNDVGFLEECGYLKSDITRQGLKFKNITLKQNEVYL